MPAISPEQITRHSLFKDAQVLLVAPMFVAFAISLFQQAGLLTGGTGGPGVSGALRERLADGVGGVPAQPAVPSVCLAGNGGGVYRQDLPVCRTGRALHCLLQHVIVLQSVDRNSSQYGLNRSVLFVFRLVQQCLSQTPVEFVDDRCPVGVLNDFFLEESSLRGVPEGGAVEGGSIFQRAVGGDEAFNGCLVGGQPELRKQVVHGVHLGLHG